MMPDEKAGLQAAVNMTVDDSEPPEGAATDQLPLWPASKLDERKKNEDPKPRGRGRPPGATNKSTNDWVDYIRSRYRSPLEMLAEVFSRPVHELANELRCDRLEAFKLQLIAAKELAPYLHSKMPQAVLLERRSSVYLSIDMGDSEQRIPINADEGLVIEGELLEPGSVENQQLSAAPRAQSDEGQSDENG